jgi:DNA-binding IclR family transcriptional regulator
MPAAGRGLSTARAVLRVLSFVASEPQGVSARDVADKLGKSLSTAYHLLASLEAEGYVARDGRTGRHVLQTVNPGGMLPAALSPDALTPQFETALQDGMREVFERTGRRTCIGIFGADGVQLVEEVGRQGIPRMTNLEKPIIRHTAHALAIGKLALAGLSEDDLRQYEADSGLRRFTSLTVCDPLQLRYELAEVREDGMASDRCEYNVDFGCLAAPVRDASGQLLAALGMTLTRHQFQTEYDELKDVLLSVTGVLEQEREPVPHAG